MVFCSLTIRTTFNLLLFECPIFLIHSARITHISKKADIYWGQNIVVVGVFDKPLVVHLKGLLVRTPMQSAEVHLQVSKHSDFPLVVHGPPVVHKSIAVGMWVFVLEIDTFTFIERFQRKYLYDKYCSVNIVVWLVI